MSKFSDAATTSHTLSLAAMEEASRIGQRTADIEHLLLALVLSEQSAGQVLRSMGITLESARAAVNEQHSAQLASLGVNSGLPPQGRIVFHETGGYEWSDRALAVIKRASGGGRRGTAADVLGELMTEPSGMIDQILRRLNTAPDQVIALIDEAQHFTAFKPRHSIRPDQRSGSIEAFIPAAVEQVWDLLYSPSRIPQWEPTINEIAGNDPLGRIHIGERWSARTRTQRPDGKQLRIKPEFQTQDVELVACRDATLIEWQFTFPESARANIKRIRIELEPAAGGTQLHIHLRWERNANRVVHPWIELLLRPLVRFGIWMHLSQLSGGIGRVFR
ncbi:Clp protease [Arthrobacter sp. MYb211]|uniref:SRPBCC family protein n=1 Tax=unclassified Arthrobacter TaxID=235627 RepID=UPI000CFD8BDE|nr:MULTISPECIES: Clp protease N-terminal domain-containing protein [unclassified Arthrobacter]PRA09870.1 Clp protease [Arthrobacter sp. MYb221]PRC04877.1 Clp protease [Arthrobacter sp. MYb211]